MAFLYYSDGVGGSAGDSLVTCSPLMASGVLYVDSVTGSNAYDGSQRTRPKATLAGAYAVATNGSVIVLLATHNETITSSVALTLKNITVVGEGQSSGQPTATITMGNNVAIALQGVGNQLRNIKFAEATTPSSVPKVNVTAARCSIFGCRFECGPNTTSGVTLDAGSTYPTIRDSTFISTATSIASVPTYGLLMGSGADGLEIYDTVFSDGAYGFGSAAFGYVSAVIPNIRAENVSLLLGAEMSVGTNPYGYIHIGTSTGGGKVF